MAVRKLLASAVVAALVLGACGDDDDDDDGALAAGGNEAYCAASAEMDEQEGFPSDAQLEDLADVAPEEISDDVRAAADILIDKGPDAFMEDGDLNQRIERIEEWEEENCPGREGEDDDEDAQPQEPDPDATIVSVTATDYEFAIDGDVPAGKVAFVMQNDGEEPHHMSVVRFKDGTTEEEAQAAAEEGFAELEALVEDEVGSSTDAEAGETAVLNAGLEPGVYGMGCFVQAADGRPHLALGMRIFFTVG